MKNLYKKIGAVILSGMVLAGLSSQELIVYANSSLKMSPYEIEGPFYRPSDVMSLSKLGVRLGAELFRYQIIGFNIEVDSINAGKGEFFSESFRHYFMNIIKDPSLKKPSKYFDGYFSFLMHLMSWGIDKGIYNFWIGGNICIFEIKEPINKNVELQDILDLIDKVNEIFVDEK